MRRGFPDGDSIERDPREEDPLVYYVPAGDWSRAVGIEIDPPYESDGAPAVTSRIWSAHVSRLASLDDATLERLASRLVQALSDAFPAWTEWRAEWPGVLAERIGRAGLRSAFEVAGWHLVGVVEDAMVWAR